MYIQNLEDNVYNKYRGILQIQELDASGKVLRHISTPNVITYDARTMLTYLLAGNTVADNYVKYLIVGTDSTAPTRNDTALGVQVDSVSLTHTFTDVDRVQFEGILPNTTPANGYTLTEAALKSEGGKIFARQIYGGLAKTIAVQLKYIWTIIFT